MIDPDLLLDLPPGAPALRLLSFRGTEGLARLFHFDLELAAAGDGPLDADALEEALLGRNVGFGVTQDGAARWFHGLVSALTQADDRLHLEVVPWLWLLSRSAATRTFTDVRLDDILREVFAGADFEPGPQIAWPRYDVCVQYRETDLNFVTRLLEHEGLPYAFRHARGRHTLTVTDGVGGGVPLVVPYRRPQVAPACREEAVHGWERRRELRAASCGLAAWHWPSQRTAAESAGTATGRAAGRLEDFAPSGGEDEARRLAALRMQEEESARAACEGHGSVAAFAAGAAFRFRPDPAAGIDGQLTPAERGGAFVLTRVEHDARAGGDGRPPACYGNRFACVPFREGSPFRPARLTPHPVIHGALTARVVGRDGKAEAGGGEEVQADAEGRVWLRLPWDRRTEGAAGAVRARVAQPWAGRGYGAHFLPRVGSECLVAFLDGDPDLPVVVDGLYHRNADLPFDPQKTPTLSGLVSRSSKDGGPGDGSELVFEDRAGAEELRLRAQRDLDVLVRHDAWTTVENDQSVSVAGRLAERVGGDRDAHVGGAFALSSGGTTTLRAGDKARLVLGPGGVTLVFGDSFIHVGEDGVRVKGPKVLLNCGGGGPGAAPAATPPPGPRRQRRRR